MPRLRLTLEGFEIITYDIKTILEKGIKKMMKDKTISRGKSEGLSAHAWLGSGMAIIVMLILSGFLTGCLSAPFQPPSGCVAVTRAPLSTEGNWEVGSRSGKASSTSVLGLYATGDCSISTAAKNGGLKKIYHVDYEYTNIIGIWQKATVIVYGE